MSNIAEPATGRGTGRPWGAAFAAAASFGIGTPSASEGAAEPAPLTVVADREVVSDAVDLSFRPEDEGLYVVGVRGRVLRLVGDSTTVVLDVSDLVSTGNEQGLLGLAFSHDGSLAYVNFTDLAGDTVIAEVAVADGGTSLAGVRACASFSQSISLIRTTTVETCSSVRTECCTSRPVTGAAAAIPIGTGRTSAAFWERSCGSIHRPPPWGQDQYTIPADNPFVRHRWSARRAGPMGSATHGGRRSIR